MPKFVEFAKLPLGQWRIPTTTNFGGGFDVVVEIFEDKQEQNIRNDERRENQVHRASKDEAAPEPIF